MEEIADFFKDFEHPVHFVGGCVRDLVLGFEPKDYDVFTPALPEQIEEYIKIKGRRVYKIGAKFGILACKIGVDNEMVEIATYRCDKYDGKTRKPEVTYTDNMIEDLQRRDFTLNTLVMDMSGKVIDHMNGLTDYNNSVLRAVGVPKHRFNEDPLRIMRAIRFACKYNLELEDLTSKRLVSTRMGLLKISQERIVDELNKILLLSPEQTVQGLRMLFEYEIFQVIIPELHLQKDYDQNNTFHELTLDEHTIRVIYEYKKQGGDETQSIWALLLHDIGKPFTAKLHKSGNRTNFIFHDVLGARIAESILTRMKFSTADKEFIVNTVRYHMEENSWTKPFDDAGKKWE